MPKGLPMSGEAVNTPSNVVVYARVSQDGKPLPFHPDSLYVVDTVPVDEGGPFVLQMPQAVGEGARDVFDTMRKSGAAALAQCLLLATEARLGH